MAPCMLYFSGMKFALYGGVLYYAGEDEDELKPVPWDEVAKDENDVKVIKRIQAQLEGKDEDS